MKIKFLELIWKPRPCTHHIFTPPSVDLQLRPAIPAGSDGILEKKPGIYNVVRSILRGESQESLEANPLSTKSNKTLCLLSIATVV